MRKDPFHPADVVATRLGYDIENAELTRYTVRYGHPENPRFMLEVNVVSCGDTHTCACSLIERLPYGGLPPTPPKPPTEPIPSTPTPEPKPTPAESPAPTTPPKANGIKTRQERPPGRDYPIKLPKELADFLKKEADSKGIATSQYLGDLIHTWCEVHLEDMRSGGPREVPQIELEMGPRTSMGVWLRKEVEDAWEEIKKLSGEKRLSRAAYMRWCLLLHRDDMEPADPPPKEKRI